MLRRRRLSGPCSFCPARRSRGSALVEKAIEWTPEVPSGYYASRALVALREQRYDGRARRGFAHRFAGLGAGTPRRRGRGCARWAPDLAARARERLIELDPTTATSRPDVLRRWRVEPVLAAELERGFAAAVPGP